MGSIEAACISGFLCRLCSEMHRTVIHIYGDQGQKHGLAKKINDYLPVTITPNDPLPKTICESCMTRVEQHHDLMLKVARFPRTYLTSHQIARARFIRAEATTTDATASVSVGSSSSDSDDAIDSDSRNRRDTQNNIYNITQTSDSTDDASTNNL